MIDDRFDDLSGLSPVRAQYYRDWQQQRLRDMRLLTLDDDGFDLDGFDADGYDREGFNRYGLNRRSQPFPPLFNE